MTVKQLKQELENFDENLPVIVSDRYGAAPYFYEDDPDLSLDVHHDYDGKEALFL